MTGQRPGPLTGVTVLEHGGLVAAPFCGMLLADMGAEVIRVDRVAAVGQPTSPVLDRGKRSVALDLRAPAGAAAFLDLVAGADVVLDPFRPGVAERLGVGPEACAARNPRLVYGRLTGWGQTGPLAPAAGHDITYLAVAGVLGHIGTPQTPVVPLNLVGDMAGGGMLLAYGIMAALLERATSGLGQVVDAAMADGAAQLMASMVEARAAGLLGERGTNFVDGGLPNYAVYACADGRHVAVGSFEPKFLGRLCAIAGVDPAEAAADPEGFRRTLTALFLTRTRDEWDALHGADPELCLAPVLDLDEAAEHPHLRARGTYDRRDGVLHPAPAPRLSGSPARIRGEAPRTGQHTDEVLGPQA